MTLATPAVHPAGLTAAQSLAFFRANGIKGQPVRMRGRRLLASYTCPTVHLGGSIAPFTHTILATPAEHHLGA